MAYVLFGISTFLPMLKNYFLIAWRNLLKNRSFSLTNLLGLVIGITCTLMIFLWVRDELTFDKFHKNYDNIYQVIANRDFNNHVFTDRNMAFPLASALEKKYPAIKHAVVTTNPYPQILQAGELKLKKTGYNVSEHFFDVFTWKTISGNPGLAIKDPSSIILTASTAKALFGDKSPLDEIIKIDNNHTAKVAAVIADPPYNSSLIFDYIQPFNYSDEPVKRAMQDWVNSSWYVYLDVEPGTNLQVLEQQINELKKSHDQNDVISTYFAFPMEKWRLQSDFKDGKNVGGMIEYVRLFILVALGILLIACVNFMNLSTARSEKRSREVGIRKTLGSKRNQLIFQFFLESMILAFIAFVIALVAVCLLLPAFNKLVDKHLTLFVPSVGFWMLALAIVLFTGLAAGSYPALYLSSFNPIKVLKGTFIAGKGAILPRRVLVVLQFVISILLISGTIIIYQQIQHIKDRPTGYDPNNLIMTPATGDISAKYSTIRQELLNTGVVDAITRTSSPITEVWWKSPSPNWEGKPANVNIIFSGLATDIGLTKTMGIKMMEGQDFLGVPADSAYMLLNKAAVEAMGLKKPVGMQMRYGRTTYTVLGIMDNVVMESPYKPVEPMMVYFNPRATSMVSIRLKDGTDPRKALPLIKEIFEKYNPAFPFEYEFTDEAFGKKFISEELINRITNLFAILAIFICCIGLAGLASFTIEKRTKEFGIRKALGATIVQLLALISKEFVRLVCIALVIAMPLTWWLMSGWLTNYIYHVNISFWLFAIVGVIVLLLTLVIVSVNTISAARTNPIKSLRSE